MPPPANSPLDTPVQHVSAISIPVPISDEAHDENVRFLRSRVRSPTDPSVPTSASLTSASAASLSSRQRRRRQTTLSEFDSEPMDVDDPSHLRMSVEINRRIPIVRRHRENSLSQNNNNNNHNHNNQPSNNTTTINSSMPNYEGHVSNSRSLYGWAPASDDDDDDHDNDDDLAYGPLHDNTSISSWFGRLSTPAARRYRRDAPVNRSPPPVPDEPSESSRERFVGSPLPTTEALLQSVRRQPRFSRTRTLHNYLRDRERAGQETTEESSRDRSGTASGPASSRSFRFLPGSRGEPHRLLTHSDLRARISAHRQLHMDNPPSPRLQETIKYLDRLRSSNSVEESLTTAAAGGFVQMDFLSWDEDDFILDTLSLAPPPICSWLRPGMVFAGSQRAASSAGSIFSQRAPSPPAPGAQDPMIVNGSEQQNNNTRVNVSTSSGRRYTANNIYNLGAGKDENWPVKVTIHNINPVEMTLSGTMEAYNIPDKTSPSHDAHIVTFLEGEIIDFNTHTLETKNFKADAEIDSTYWRELQPFKNLTDEEMTRNLVSRKWLTESLAREWILMRWKERCFITPTDSRQGLTISGFYYISLHRESGHIEGLYYDPGSSPYQQLSLQPETKKMVRPSYSFR